MATEAQDWCTDYYEKKGADRNDLLGSQGMLWQHLATDASVFAALKAAKLERETACVLDVGCGEGATIGRLITAGFEPWQLTGVDVQEHRLQRAQDRYNAIFRKCDGRQLPYDDGAFDLVTQTMMFAQLEQWPGMQVAGEMLRVTRPGGYILLVDWRYASRGTPLHLANVWQLFKVGQQTKLIRRFPGALVPPIGRFLSKWCPWTYFLVAAFCPPLVGQHATLLRRNQRSHKGENALSITPISPVNL